MYTKKPSVAGTFYPNSKDKISLLVSDFKISTLEYPQFSSRLVIVPHAGYIYSGKTAFLGLSKLNKEVRNIFVLAPSHKVYFHGIAVSNFDNFETPLGNVEVNREIVNDLYRNYNCKRNDDAFKSEHAIEVQLPLLQSIFQEFKIVPIVIGDSTPQEVENIISRYYDDKTNAFVISSDLSHFLHDKDANKLDEHTADMIESKEINGFMYKQACNSIGILGAVKFAKKNDYNFIRLDMHNSSQTTNDKDSVVGYGCWVLSESSVNSYIKNNYSEFVKKTCMESIKNNGKYYPENCPDVLKQRGACFVTLEKQGMIRGCIGSIVPYRRLIDDIIQNAKSAAYSDPRFEPLRESEMSDIEIKISLLSIPSEINFKDENDLLEQIVPNKDGIIISDKNYRAVYLPSVWEQLPDKKEFLNSLKQKAGLHANHFSKTFKAYRFYTEYI